MTISNDNFSNNEEVRMQCTRCNGEEDTCGAMMLMKTRARKLKERQDSSKKGDSTDYPSIAPDENDQRDLTVTESIPKRSAKSKHERETSSELELEQSIENDRRTVDPEINRIFVGEN